MNPAPAVSAASILIPASAIRRNTWLLFVGQVMLSMGLSTAAQLGSLIIYRFSGTPALAGVPTGIYYLSMAVVAFPAGRFMDRRGRRPGLMLGFLVGGLGAALVALSVSAGIFPTYILGVIVYSLGVGAGMLVRAAVADMYVADQRAGAVGWVVTGGLLGGIGGPMMVAVGDRVARAIGADPLALPYLFVFGAFAVAVAAMSRLRPDPREISARLAAALPVQQVPGQGPARVREHTVAEIVASRPAQAAMIALACAQATMVMLMATSALMLSMHGHPISTISLVMMAHVTGMFALSIPVGRLADRIGRRPVLVGGALLSATSGLLFALGVHSAVWAALAFYLVGLGWCLAFVAGTALLGDVSGTMTRAGVVGFNDLLTNLSAMSAAVLGGVLLARGGEVTVGIIAAILGSVPLLGILRAGRALVVPKAAAVPVPADWGK